jgi:hypothetical protein
MRKRSLATLFLFASSALVQAAGGSSYSMDVDLTKGDRPDAYLCKAVISDLETGEVLAAPMISFTADSPATVSSEPFPLKDGDRRIEFTIAVDAKRSSATAELKVTRAGEVLAAQKTTMAMH